MYFRQLWIDPRVESDKYARDLQSALDETKIIGGVELSEKIWKPDTFFVNEASTEVKQVLVRIKPSGEVLFSQRIVVCFLSNGNFRNYPWDVNGYTLEFESFGYTMNTFKYSWMDGNKSVHISPDANIFGDRYVVGHRPRTVEAMLSSGNYSRLLLDVFFTRHSGSTVQSVFVPVALITCLALLSSLLPNAEVAGKTVALVTTTLAIIGLKTWLHTTVLHSVYYTTHATIYLNLHLAVIVLLNINFFFSRLLSTFSTSSKQGEEIQMRQLEREDSSSSSSPFFNPLSTQLSWASRAEMAASAIPPLLFVLGQAAFWISVSSISPENELSTRGDVIRVE